MARGLGRRREQANDAPDPADVPPESPASAPLAWPPTPDPPAATPDPSEANLELARRLYELFNRGDLDSATEMASEEVEVELVPFGQVFRGRVGFRHFLNGFKGAFPDLTVTVTSQLASGDRVVNECSWTGTNTGPLLSVRGEIPPTGRTVTGARFCEIWTIRDGEVARLVNYQDAATWLRQIGLNP